MAIPGVNSNEDIISNLKAKAEQFGDLFRLKIFRKRAGEGAQLTEHIATFNNVSLQYIAAPETWLPRVFGGGAIFSLHMYPMLDTLTPTGAPIQLHVAGQLRQRFDFSLIFGQHWNGPTDLLWPSKEELSAVETPIQMNQSSVPPLGGASAANVSAGGGGTDGSYPQQQAQQFNPAADSAWRVVEQARRELDLRERKIELERVQAQSDVRLRELEMKFLAARPVEKPALDLPAMLAAAAPIVTAMLAAAADARKEAQESNKLLAMQNQEILKVVLSDKQDDAPMAKMMSAMTDTMGSIMKIQNNFMQQVADFGQPKEESNGMKITREVVKGIQAFASGMAATGAAARPALPLRALPPQQGKKPVLRQVPPQVQTTPVPQAAEATVPASVPAPVAAAVPVTDLAEATKQISDVAVTDRLIEMIQARVHPYSVVDLFFEAVDSEDETLIVALQQVEGNPVRLFQTRLDPTWIMEPSNIAYIQQLLGALDATAQDRMSTDAQNEGSDGEEEDAETEDQAEAV